MIKKKLQYIFSLAIFVFSTILLNAQTVAYPIDYSKSGLSTTDKCNVLQDVNSTVKIGGYVHLPYSGGATFDGTNLILQTMAGVNTNPNYGTAYEIVLPLKLNYSYTFSVESMGTDGSGSQNPTYPNILLSMSNSQDDPATTNATACNSVTQDYWSQLGQSTFYNFTATNTKATYTSSSFVATTGTVYLRVLAYGGSTSFNNVLISKITINETSPAKFTIAASTSPATSPTSITCGSQTPVTFSVTNVNNTTGVTDYTFNVGTTPNDWLLPNGSAAPATIDAGTSPSLTLTPTCGGTLTSVSATVTVNGTTVNTANSASVTINQPTMSIVSASGSSTVCSSDNYSIPTLPCNASVVWSVSPSGIVTPSSPTGPTTSLTNTGTSGNITLSAAVTSCGGTQTLTMPLHIGGYTSSDYNLVNNTTNSNFYCVGKSISFSVTGAAASNYVWTIPPGWQTLYGGNGNNYDAILPTTTPTGTVSVNFTEPCGTTVTENTFLAYSNNVCVNNDPRYGYSPNPAPTNLNVYVNSAYLTNTFFTQIQLIQINTGSLVFSQNYGSYTQNATIYMGSFPTGSYTLRVFDGSVWATYIIMH